MEELKELLGEQKFELLYSFLSHTVNPEDGLCLDDDEMDLLKQTIIIVMQHMEG
jgi:hypothetical protein